MKNKLYDIFLSHDFEDKSAIADEITEKLRETGFTVWYSGTDLKAGDNLEEVVLNKIIPASTYTVALISNNYINSIWTRKEFNAAVSLETKRRKIIIPVLFNVSFEEVAVVFPIQQLRFAITVENLDKTVRQLVKACKITEPEKKAKKHIRENRPATNITDAGGVALDGNITITGDNAAGRDISINPIRKKQ